MQIHKQNNYHEDLEFLHNDIDYIHQWWHDTTVGGEKIFEIKKKIRKNFENFEVFERDFSWRLSWQVSECNYEWWSNFMWI